MAQEIDIYKMNFIGDTMPESKQCVTSSEVKRTFEVKVVKVENLPDTQEINESFIFISIGLYYGNQLLITPVETQPISATCPLWDQWLKFPILYSEIPPVRTWFFFLGFNDQTFHRKLECVLLLTY